MKKLTLLAVIVAALTGALIGCGGDPGFSASSSITGKVVDLDSGPLRGAIVRADGESTITTSSGGFQLFGITNGEVKITAEYFDDSGATYEGETWVYNFAGEETKSALIVAAPETQLGEVWGEIRNRDGALLENMPVFAYSGAGSAARTFSNADGIYEFKRLVGGIDYEITAMAWGYRSDGDWVNPTADSSIRLDLVLGDAGTPTLDPPNFLTAISWVSPTVDGRGQRDIEWFKQMYEPDRKAKKVGETRNLRDDLLAEVELEWDEQRFDDHLGWGVYRADVVGGLLNGLYFMDDPLSAWFFDSGVQTRRSYEYAVTTLSAWFPDDYERTESLLSNIVEVEVLDRLDLRPFLYNPLEFQWAAGSYSEDYIVFLFDRYPGPGVDSVWNSSHQVTTGLSFVYDGPSLQVNKEYYYIVLGLANNDTSRTLSEIGSFIR
jgi:hypothetical protein